MAAFRLGIVIVFAANVLSMQTLSVETGTVPPVQFEAVAQELSPAVPVHCFVPVAQVATAIALQKAVHDSNMTSMRNVFILEFPQTRIARLQKVPRFSPCGPVEEGQG